MLPREKQLIECGLLALQEQIYDDDLPDDALHALGGYPESVEIQDLLDQIKRYGLCHISGPLTGGM